MTKQNYSEKVEKLLKLGPTEADPENGEPDYINELGLTLENVPELTQLATDYELLMSEEDEENEEDVSYMGPIHAWRALAQLKATDTAEELVKTFDWEDTDFPEFEMPFVFSELGPATIPVLQKYLSDTSHEYFPRVIALNSLKEMADNNPEAKDQVIEVLTKQLEAYTENPPELNAFFGG